MPKRTNWEKRESLFDEAFQYRQKTNLDDYIRWDTMPQGYRKQLHELNIRIEAISMLRRRGSGGDMAYCNASPEKRKQMDTHENKLNDISSQLRIFRKRVEETQKQKQNQKKFRSVQGAISKAKNMDGPNVSKMILQYL